MAKPTLTAKEELFAQAYIERTGDKVQAYKDAGYSLKLNSAAMAVQADKLYNKPKINLKIQELQKKADKIANEKFSISVEKRLKWLEQIVEAGLSDYTDAQENNRKENLAASKGAIETMNSMLGVSEKGDKVKPVKVVVGVVDAS